MFRVVKDWILVCTPVCWSTLFEIVMFSWLVSKNTFKFNFVFAALAPILYADCNPPKFPGSPIMGLVLEGML